MVGIFDCGGVLGKYEIRLKERKVVNMEALNTYKTEKTLAEQMNERLAEMKMTKAEAALKMNYSRAALSQYLNGKYASDPTELEKKVREFLAATGGVAEGQEPENSVPTGAGTLKKKVEFFESRDFVQTIGVCQACQEYMGLGIIVGKSGQGKTHALKKYAELPKAVPGVLDARIDAQHPRGQGTVDVIVTGAAGEASPELIRKVGEAIEPLKGNYEDYLVKSSEVVRQDFELVIYLAEDAATDGVDAQATKLIEDMMALTRGEMNTLYRDSIIQVLSTKIDNYRKTDILQPSDDMVLEQDKVIMAGDINVTVRNVVQSARGKE